MGFFQPGGSNAEKMQNMRADKTLRNRDVYNTQQTDRSDHEPLQTMTSRKIITVALTVAVFFASWAIGSFVGSFLDGSFFTGGMMGGPSVDFGFTFKKFLLCTALSAGFYIIVYWIFLKNLDAQNADKTTGDINQYENDQHIAFPEEVQAAYDWFPDVGATSSVVVSSMLSHMALAQKGLKTIKFAKRAEQDIVDEDGEIVLYKGEVLRDDDGNVLFEDKPIIDEKFMGALFDASGLPATKDLVKFRQFYDARKIKYNPGNQNRDKLQDKAQPYNTVADVVNRDWEVPWYEPQRPGGAYIVDTAPVNTMVYLNALHMV